MPEESEFVVDIGCNACENTSSIDTTDCFKDAEVKHCPICGSDDIDVLTD